MTWTQMLTKFMDEGATADEALASAYAELQRMRDEALADAGCDEERDYIEEIYGDDIVSLKRVWAEQEAAHRETEACPEWAR